MVMSRPVNPRATRSALIEASVPEFTSRTISTDGTRSRISSASSISRSVGAPKLVPISSAISMASITAGCRCPNSSGPQEQM